MPRAWMCSTLNLLANSFYHKAIAQLGGNLSPDNHSPTLTTHNHSQTGRWRFANNCYLIFNCRQTANMLQSMMNSTVKHLCNRRLDSTGYQLVLFWLDKSKVIKNLCHFGIKLPSRSNCVAIDAGNCVSNLQPSGWTMNVSRYCKFLLNVNVWK